MDDKLDMSMMFAMHDALRRELAQVARIARLRDDHPGQLLRAALGWELFKKFLVVHHQAEDDTLWPALRARVAGRPERVALADALEAEHAVIEPLLTAIDAAAADPGYGYQRFGDIVDELATKLTAHLAHEETDGLPLIDASLTPQEWQNFAQDHTERLRGDAATYMPWLLNGASPQMLDAVLGKFPPPLLTAFREQWSPRYAALDIWPPTAEATVAEAAAAEAAAAEAAAAPGTGKDSVLCRSRTGPKPPRRPPPPAVTCGSRCSSSPPLSSCWCSTTRS